MSIKILRNAKKKLRNWMRSLKKTNLCSNNRHFYKFWDVTIFNLHKNKIFKIFLLKYVYYAKEKSYYFNDDIFSTSKKFCEKYLGSIKIFMLKSESNHPPFFKVNVEKQTRKT